MSTTSQAFNLKAPTIPVLSVGGAKAKLTDLKPGIAVTLQLSESDDVETIVAGAAARNGTFLSFDAGKMRLTLDGNKKGEGATYSVSDATAVSIYGHKKTLKELRPGQHLLLVLSFDLKNVASVVAGVKRTRDDPGGALASVDANQRTVTLLVGMNKKYRLMTWPLAKDFHFLFNEVERPGLKLSDLRAAVSVADLPRSPHVWLRLGEDGKSVALMVAEPAAAPALIHSVDAAKRTLVARLDNGAPETLIVEENAEIIVAGKRTSLENLAAGMSAQLTFAFEPGRLLGVRTKKE